MLLVSANMERMTASYERESNSISINGETDVVVLYPGDYVYVRHYVERIIIFSFQCDNPNVKVTAYLMEDNYFESFQHDMGYAAFYLSNGPKNSASGRYEVPHEDYWNIVFINEESNGESTILRYQLQFDNEDPFIYITPILAVSLVVGVVVSLFLIRRKKPRESVAVLAS